MSEFTTKVYDNGRFIDINDSTGVTVAQIFAKTYSSEDRIKLAILVAKILTTEWDKQ